MNQELYCHVQYRGYDIFVNSPEWRYGDDHFEGFIYFDNSALKGWKKDKTGEGCLEKCKEWVDEILEGEE